MPNRTLPFRSRETGLSPVWAPVTVGLHPKPCWQSTFAIIATGKLPRVIVDQEGDCTGTFLDVDLNQVDCLPMYSIS